MKRHIIYIFLIITTLGYAQDEVTFEAKVSKEQLGLNERLRIDFEMNKDGDNFVPPNFENFRVLMGPSQSVSQSWINGKRSFSKTYSYILAPKKKGTFTIKQAVIEIDSQTYKTVPITIQVTAAVDNPNAPKGADDIADENLHLVAEISNPNPYLNEAVSILYKLYVSPKISVSDFRPIDNPTYNNFWSQNMEIKRWKVENGTYKGKAYRYVILKKVVVYPQKTGALEIEPLTLDVTVDVPTNKQDIFGGRVYKQAHKTIAAGSRTIRVKPLPDNGKPEGFTGAVGSFDFNVVPSKTDLKAGESLEAKIEVSGKGNLKLFDLPKLKLPSSVEVYEPEFKSNVSTNISGMQGKITDDYTVVPQYKGKFQIPTISFSYFDPKLERYKTLTSPEHIINVYEGPTSDDDAITENNQPEKQVVNSLDSSFKFLKLTPNLQPIENQTFFGSKAFYILFFGPLLLIPLFIIIGKKKKALEADIEGTKRRKANKLAKKYLSEAKKNLGDKESFYEAMERALHNYLKAQLKIETSDFSKEKITDLLRTNKVDETVITSFISILNSCELARYTPTSVVTMQQDYDKAANTISLIDKQVKV
ncbi:BatD family protein [Zhouia amylolytica]|uniref:BatD family protein n=1 Tax=Zhouia amylolytica TaxID=376730 RepID=UPI0020CBBEA7|nr:BatD family protein [Zhouia amylolytica]MCQ0110868.1 protein BatD [Zhouia amylolytica]